MVALVDGTGAKVVEYSYDAWGKPTGKTGSLAGTLGTVQPFRYRGYVFDEETGDYYLRSRYYWAEMGRFFNADMVIDGNLYEYCHSNPVNRSDQNGNWDEEGGFFEQLALEIIKRVEIRIEESLSIEDFEILPGIELVHTFTTGASQSFNKTGLNVVYGENTGTNPSISPIGGIAVSGQHVFSSVTATTSSMSVEVGLDDRSIGVTFGFGNRYQPGFSVDIGVNITHYGEKEYIRDSYSASVRIEELLVAAVVSGLAYIGIDATPVYSLIYGQ